MRKGAQPCMRGGLWGRPFPSKEPDLAEQPSRRNLITITEYTGFDPEVNNFGIQSIRANIDVSPYPPSRSFWLSMDVRF